MKKLNPLNFLVHLKKTTSPVRRIPPVNKYLLSLSFVFFSITFATSQVNNALMITCPPDLALDCADVIPTGATTLAEFVAQGGTITDAVNPTITFADVATGSCGSFNRIYTVEDGATSTTCLQAVLITDTEAPVVSCPPNQTLTCFESVPQPFTSLEDFIAAGGAVNDNCTTDLSDFTIFSQQASNGGNNCPGNVLIVTRMYYIQDACGNTSTCMQSFNYQESTTGPIITNALPTCYKNCIELATPHPDDLEYTTDCHLGATVTVSGPVENGTHNCPGTTYTYTYTVTDECGRSASTEQTIVIGNEGPTITCPSFNLTLECNDPNNDDYIDAYFSLVSASPSCWLDVDITNDFTGITFGPCPTSKVVTFTATDACGRTATCSAIIIIEDSQPPVITEVPPSVCDAIECGEANAEFWFDHWIDYMLEGLVAVDVCDPNVTWSTIPDPPMLNMNCDPITGDAITVVTFVASDYCGNTATVTGTFIVENDVPPAYENVPPDHSVSCGDPIVFGPPPTLVDECDASEEITTIVDNSDPCNVLHMRTWTATDFCGGLSTAVTQTITEVDDAPPVISGGADITVECDGMDNLAELQVWLDDHAGATAIDACDNGENWTDDFDPSNIVMTTDCLDGIFSYVDVTFTATDNCGNFSSITRRFNTTDTTAPEFDSNPADGIIACDETPVFDNLTATDICSGAAGVTFVNTSSGDSCAGSYTRTWTAEDACGNTASISQTFSYEDNQAPVFTSVPGGGDFECASDASFSEPTATDDCNTLNITFVDDVQGDICTGTVTRTYTATDACGNSATASATVTYDDSTPPVFTTVPTGGNFECATDAVFTEPDATDNCTDVTITHLDAIVGDNCTGSVVRTYTATDECGNTSTASAAVSYDDSTPPVFTTVPTGGDFECASDAIFTEPDAMDNCTDVTITHDDAIVGDNCTGSVVRTYTATDECGNTSTASASVSYDDNTPPTFTSIPPGGDFECLIDAEFELAVGIDNCTEVTITFDDVVTGDDCTGSILRTFTATDECDNSTTATAFVTYDDTMPPVFTSVPTGNNLQCPSDAMFGETLATDNCILASITSTDEITGDGCTGSVIRTWVATDACGNSTSTSVAATYDDDLPPVFTSVPTGGSYQCALDVVFDTPTTDDNCNDVTVTSEDEMNGTTCVGTVTRIWTATDDCGNTSTASATAIYEDDVAPEFTFVPQDQTIACDANPVFGEPTADDYCNEEDITFEDTFFGDACDGGYTRTWTATDACGNFATASQTLTYSDQEPPVFDFVPQGGTVACGTDVVFEDPIVSDNCNLVTVFSNDTENGDDCEGGITRVWTATDACGNSSTASATFMINDDEPPVFTSMPVSGEFNCLADIIWQEPTATDNCNAFVITFEDVLSGDDCEGMVTRTWTVTDACGNSSTMDIISTYEDEISPVFTTFPTGDMIECFDEVVTNMPTATDNCFPPVLTSSDETIGTYCSGSINRTWVATDACGNTATTIQVITVEDVTPPVLFGVPADVTVACDAVPAIPDVTATDNCDPDVPVSYSELINPGDCPQSYTLVRIWSAADDCDNFVSATQTIIVEDNETPILIGVPADAAVECDQLLPPADVTAVDNCDLDVPVTLTETTDGDCPFDYVLTRTWTAEDDCGNATSAMQVIDVADTTPPEISCFEPNSIVRFLGDFVPPIYCKVKDFIPVSATDNCSATDDITISWTMDFGPDGPDGIIDSTGIIMGGTTLSDSFCVGTSFFVFTATDECGNSSSCTYTVEVVDNVPPSFFTSAVSRTLVFDPITMEWCAFSNPYDYLILLSDCCEAEAQFILPDGTFADERKWTCDDTDALPEGVPTGIRVTDCFGNFIDVFPKTIVNAPGEGGPNDVCDPEPPGFGSVTGTVFTEEVEFVEDVTVNLSGGMEASGLTNEFGNYSFEGLSVANNYVITPEKNNEHMNGVSTYDLVLISKHILEQELLDSPYKMIAADINNSGSITTFDLIQLRKVILFIETEFPNNESWRFVSADFVFPYPENPFATVFPEAININDLQNIETHDFVGVKIGDVNSTVVANGLQGADDRSFNGDLNFKIEEKLTEVGETFEVAFRSDDFKAIAGFQYTLNFDANQLEFVAIEAGDLTGMSEANFGLSLLDEGAIPMSWASGRALDANADTDLFRITFKAKRAAQLSEALSIGSRFTKAEAYDVATDNGQLNLLNVNLRFETVDGIKMPFSLKQNAPNPFRDATVIGFVLPETATASLTVYDISGKQLMQVSDAYEAGYNEITLSRGDLSEGVMYYQLVTDKHTATKQMILLNK